jgi:hypothetical protein
VGTVPAGHFLDPRDTLVAPIGDDVRRAELQGQLLPGLVAAHGDDPLRAELAGGEDGHLADRTVTDDGDGLAPLHVGGDGTEPAGAEHVRGGEQAGDQAGVRPAGSGD